jgi:hypothetical protein
MAIRVAKNTSLPPARETPSDTRSPSVASRFGHNPRETQEERIRVRAYFLAEAAGFPEGRADQFWLQAEKEAANQ